MARTLLDYRNNCTGFIKWVLKVIVGYEIGLDLPINCTNFTAGHRLQYGILFSVLITWRIYL